MTKALYIPGNAILSEDERAAYKGCRFENAAYFSGVASSVTEAAVAGDYPEIMEALQAAGIEAEVITLECDGGEAPENNTVAELESVSNGKAAETESKPDQENQPALELEPETQAETKAPAAKPESKTNQEPGKQPDPKQDVGKAGNLTNEQKGKVLEAVLLLVQDTDKKPNVKAVEELTGFDISAADRDEAWDKHKQA